MIALVLIIAMIATVAIWLAALVDPFDWMPSSGEIWADCEGDCELAHRFPGFWWHVVANLSYAAIAAATAKRFGTTVGRLRRTRVTRYASAEAMDDFRRAHSEFLDAGKLLAGLATISILASIS